MSGQEASGQVGRLGRQPRAGQQLQSFSFQLRTFAVFLQPAFPTQPVHPGGKSPSPRPGLEGECSINDNCAHFFLFVFFFFSFDYFIGIKLTYNVVLLLLYSKVIQPYIYMHSFLYIPFLFLKAKNANEKFICDSLDNMGILNACRF